MEASKISNIERSNRPFFSLWIGDELGTIEKISLKSFAESGRRTILYTYGDVAGIPGGVEVRDAREFVAETRIFQPEAHGKTFSGFSNYFRYSVLKYSGGIWFDLDMVLLDSSFEFGPYVIGTEALGRANGAILSYPQDSPLADFLLQECDTRSRTNYSWGDLGPNLITEAIGKFGLWSEVADSRRYYPVHYREVWKLFDPRRREQIERVVDSATCLHLWNEVLRQSPNSIAKNGPRPHGSYLEVLEAQLGADRSRSATSHNNWALEDWRKIIDPPRKRILRALDKQVRVPALRSLLNITFAFASQIQRTKQGKFVDR